MTAVTSPSSQVDELAARAGALYSLPAVAVEVLALTNNPKVDVRALKECIERDPALTAKLLRVVNSSLFGLSREVADLNQALALLGVKPLKMLVLGFSLPEELFAGAGREQLEWYWRHTLSRAVAAREISEQLIKRPGDDVFVAALLQDVGVLVLLGELGQPYAEFLGEVIHQRANLRQVQIDALGFDHAELSAKLLDNWRMPCALVDAVAAPRIIKKLAKLDEPYASICRTLHLAELTAQLVAERKLSVLPDLLEAGAEFFQMDRVGLDALIAELEPKVAQLAGVLHVDLDEGDDFAAIIAAAHERMAALAEEAAAEMAAGEQSIERIKWELTPLLAEVAEPVREAIGSYLHQPDETIGVRRRVRPGRHVAEERANAAKHADAATPLLYFSGEGLSNRLAVAVGCCRAARQSLSALAVSIDADSPFSPAESASVHEAVRRAWLQAMTAESLLPTDDPSVLIALLSDCERQEAVALGGQLVRRLRSLLDQLTDAGRLPQCRVAAGVAAVNVPARNFPPCNLLEAALRCLAASQCSAGAVKSIEIS